jgi:hypothetical protein
MRHPKSHRSLANHHRKTAARKHVKRHIVGVIVGTSLMVVGVLLSLNSEHTGFPVVAEMLAWTLHGVGCIPILKPVEALWPLLFE